VDVTRSDPPTPQARAVARATQRLEWERAARAKDRRIRWRERLEQCNKEYRLCEQRGLSPPLVPVNSSSDEEEEEEGSDGGRAAPERWDPLPPSPRAADLVPVAGAEALAARPSVEVPASTAEALAGATEPPPEPSRKRKRAFSNLR
jgi:hypothetical protein